MLNIDNVQRLTLAIGNTILSQDACLMNGDKPLQRVLFIVDLRHNTMILYVCVCYAVNGCDAFAVPRHLFIYVAHELSVIVLPV